MQLTFQPVVERELRVAARRRSTYWTRGLAALLAGGFAVWILGVTVSAGGPVNGGRAIFTNLSVCAWFACLFAGVFLTADCLSFEKREGTLGLLFLTDLRGYDIVLGKLAATSLTAFYGLIAVFPVLAIPLILGGVTWWEFARMATGLAFTLFFSLAMGMFFSASNRHEHTGMVATALAIGGWTLVFGIAAETRWLTPLGTVWFAFDQAFAIAPGRYFASLFVVGAFGVAALAFAAWRLPQSWGDLPATSQKKNPKHAGTADELQRLLPLAAKIRALMLERNPAGWLVSRRNRPLVLWSLIGLAITVMTFAWFSTRTISAVIPVLLVIAVHGTLKLCMAWEASHLLAEHRRTGGLELVLVTDLGVNEFLQGCRAALREMFTSITLVVIVLDLILGGLAVAASLKTGGPGGGDPLTSIILVIVVLVGMLLVDLWSLSWVGLWLGLRHRWPWQAAFASVARVIALPWAIAFAGMLLEGATVGGTGWPVALVLLWIFASFFLSYLFGRQACASIHADLREEISAWMPGNVRRKPAERPATEEYYELVR